LYCTAVTVRDCIGPVVEEDSVTMNLEYRGETEGVKDIEKAITVRYS